MASRIWGRAFLSCLAWARVLFFVPLCLIISAYLPHRIRYTHTRSSVFTSLMLLAVHGPSVISLTPNKLRVRVCFFCRVPSHVTTIVLPCTIYAVRGLIREEQKFILLYICISKRVSSLLAFFTFSECSALHTSPGSDVFHICVTLRLNNRSRPTRSIVDVDDDRLAA